MDNILTVKGDRTDICLVRCVHRFLSDSANGKSAIYGISEQDPTFDARVVRVWKDSLYRDLQRILTTADDRTIIIVDRLDMYGTQDIWDMLFNAANKCILVDSKYDWDYRIKEVNAFVTLTKGGVKVRDDYTRGR